MPKKIPRPALWLMGLLLFLSIFRDVLANGRPLYCRIGGTSYWPGLRTIFVAETTPFEAAPLRALQNQLHQMEVWKDPANFDSPPVYAPIPFSPGENSTRNVHPLGKPGSVHAGLTHRFVHWLGTDAEGRDVAATVVSGARIALLTGALAMLVALSIGLGLGMLAGFFGDDRLRIDRGQLIFFLLSIPVAWFCAVTLRAYTLSTAKSSAELWITLGIFFFVVYAFGKFGSIFRRVPFLSTRIVFPADLIVMRLAEIFSSIPRLILVIVMAVALRGLTNESIWLMIALIGAFSWTGVARLVRAELLRVRALDYVAAARGLGMSEWRVLLRHALPNTLRPVYIAFALGAANAVLLEANLSFLGYGGQSFRGVSWGSLFYNESSAANPLESWWVTLAPGLMIFLTVLSLNKIGEAFSDRQ